MDKDKAVKPLFSGFRNRVVGVVVLVGQASRLGVILACFVIFLPKGLFGMITALRSLIGRIRLQSQ